VRVAVRAPSLLPCLLFLLAACGAPADPRQAVIADTLERADDAMIRARPMLVAGEYSLMTNPGISFLRGSLPLYLRDFEDGSAGLGASSFALETPLVPCVGDPHPENFGTLLAADGTVGLELDDFDTADRAPYLFDVRRFVTGLALAANLANAGDPMAQAATVAAARDIARAGAEGYVAGIQAAASGSPPGRVVAPTGNVYLDELLAKAAADAVNRDELTTDTAVDSNGQRHLIRGVIDTSDPQNVFGDLPAFAVQALPEVLAAYQTTLLSPPSPEFFTVLDAVREYGAGVASWPKLRAIVLIRGANNGNADNELLEVKEVSDSGIAGLYPPGVYADNVQDRDILFSRAAWSRPDADPYWGASSWVGFPVQVRHETAAARGVKVDDLTGAYGSVDVLTGLAHILGTILARLHSASLFGEPSPAGAIWSRIATNPNGFEDEQADVGVAYAEQTLADQTGWQSLMQTLGLNLGVLPDPGDAPSPDLAALLGTPPAPPPPTPPSP
jgi:hypothetical protein